MPVLLAPEAANAAKARAAWLRRKELLSQPIAASGPNCSTRSAQPLQVGVAHFVRPQEHESHPPGNKPVATTVQGFNETRVLGIIPQGFAQLLDTAVEAVIEVNEGVCGPKLSPQLLPGDRLSGALQKNSQDLKGLFLQLDADATLA